MTLKKKLTKTANKQINETNNIKRPSEPNTFFRKIFHMQFTCFYLKILLRKYKPFML